ncbi:MAG: hypothetical protein HGGPFJEG_02010 [Ignavibacteria bacterium]|nr:hypothetical protein [Ignavibacteria bacterium]
MSMIYITRREHFSSSHKLENPKLSKKQNEEMFGKCSNFHGHNYYIEVTLKGNPDKDSSYVMDLKLLKKIIFEEIIEKVDHKYLNDVDLFRKVIPTTENMAIIFWDLLAKRLKQYNVKLHSVKLYETEKNFVEYKGEK